LASFCQSHLGLFFAKYLFLAPNSERGGLPLRPFSSDSSNNYPDRNDPLVDTWSTLGIFTAFAAYHIFVDFGGAGMKLILR